MFLFLDPHHFIAVQDAERIKGEFQLFDRCQVLRVPAAPPLLVFLPILLLLLPGLPLLLLLLSYEKEGEK